MTVVPQVTQLSNTQTDVPPGSSTEPKRKRPKLGRKTSVEPGYNYNNPNYENRAASIVKIGSGHKNNRGSASTTGTGNLSKMLKEQTWLLD